VNTSTKAKGVVGLLVAGGALLAANQAVLSVTGGNTGAKILQFPLGGRDGRAAGATGAPGPGPGKPGDERERPYTIEVRWSPNSVAGYWTSRVNGYSNVMPLGLNADKVGHGRPASPQKTGGTVRVGDYIESTMNWVDYQGRDTGPWVSYRYCRITVGSTVVDEGDDICAWRVS
jgi:hypothetical protein